MKQFSIFLSLILGLCSLLPAQTLHVVMLIDCYSGIALSCGIDRQNIQKELDIIKAHTGMSLRMYPCEYDPASAKQVAQSIICGADDVILFYYSGHGYRYEGQKDPFPYMAFRARTATEFSSGKMVSLQNILDILKEKNARLTLILGDLCNNELPMTEPLSQDIIVTTKEDVYKNLFLYSKGYLLSTSSKAGQISQATDNGSRWTLDFLETLHDAALHNNAANWETILANTDALCNQKSGARQDPYYDNKTSATTIEAGLDFHKK